jgi:hypothetical protein
MEFSKTKISRMETTLRGSILRDIRDLCHTYSDTGLNASRRIHRSVANPLRAQGPVRTAWPLAGCQSVAGGIAARRTRPQGTSWRTGNGVWPKAVSSWKSVSSPEIRRFAGCALTRGSSPRRGPLSHQASSDGVGGVAVETVAGVIVAAGCTGIFVARRSPARLAGLGSRASREQPGRKPAVRPHGLARSGWRPVAGRRSGATAAERCSRAAQCSR